MHNVKAADYKARLRDPKVVAALTQKASQWNALTSSLAQKRLTLAGNSGGSDAVLLEEDELQKILKVTEKLLSVNPDPMYLYNQRREVLLLRENAKGVSIDPPLFQIDTELSMTATCLKRNPKAYGPWFHRKWAIRQFLVGDVSKDQVVPLLNEEMDLCAQFLLLDERNFHCWNYRRFVVSCLLASAKGDMTLVDGSWETGFDSMGKQIACGDVHSACVVDTDNNEIRNILISEWDFTTEKIESNFSNYSAYHYRSKLIPLISSMNKEKSKIEVVREELEIINQAIFTEPDDQSSWWYYQFLISWLISGIGEGISDKREVLDVLEEECNIIEELVEAEDDKCKWGILALSLTFDHINKLEDNPKRRSDEDKQRLHKLIELDDYRTNRYEQLMNNI